MLSEKQIKICEQEFMCTGVMPLKIVGNVSLYGLKEIVADLLCKVREKKNDHKNNNQNIIKKTDFSFDKE